MNNFITELNQNEINSVVGGISISCTDCANNNASYNITFKDAIISQIIYASEKVLTDPVSIGGAVSICIAYLYLRNRIRV